LKINTNDKLINFVKVEADLESDLDRWLYVLKNMSTMEKLPIYLRKPIFEKLFQVAEYSKLSKEEREMYDVSLKRKWDEKAVLDYAKEEGKKEERAKAEAEKIESAFKMLQNGFDVEMISDIIGLPIEEIQKLK